MIACQRKGTFLVGMISKIRAVVFITLASATEGNAIGHIGGF